MAQDICIRITIANKKKKKKKNYELMNTVNKAFPTRKKRI